MGRSATEDWTLEKAIEELKSSPMFQLSLASKELFHSNLLAWLCETYPQQAGKLFAGFLEEPPASYDRLEVEREKKSKRGKRKIDLWLKFPNGQELFIENKVKSVPGKEQLQEIADGNRGPRKRFLLLSLSPPTFKAHEWRTLSYEGLLVELGRIQPEVDSKNHYHGELLRDYFKFIYHLVSLCSYFSIDWADDESDFFVADDHVKQLKEIRIQDLVLKRWYSELASRIAESLRKNGFEVVETNAGKPKTGHNLRPGQVFVGTRFVKGRALSAFSYLLTVDSSDRPQVMLGVEIQDHAFHLFIKVRKHGVAPEAPKIALQLWKPGAGKKGWFDFGLVQDYSDLLERPNKRGDQTFCKFAPYGILYRYTRLNEISPTRLVEVFVRYAESIRANEQILRDQVKT